MRDDLIEAALATGLGLIVGLEREHSVEPGGREPLFGVRTFALIALLGWTSIYLGGGAPWLPIAAVAVTTALLVSQYLRAPEGDLGLTTELAAIVILFVGMLVPRDRLLAVSIALGATVLLISKPWVRHVVPRLRRQELTGTLQLLVVLAIVLPLLPVEARDPWGVLSPRKIGLFVTLIAGISFVGYVLTRLFGARRGAGLSGLLGGLASSTAVTASMAQGAAADRAMATPAQLATLLANAVMFVRVLVVTAVISRDVARSLAMPIGVAAAVTVAGAAWRWRAMRGEPAREPVSRELPLENPFALVPALKWGLALSAVLVLAAVARDAVGERGLLATAAASGLADVDAITLAVARQAAAGALDTGTATLAVTLAVVANTLVKVGIAWFTAGRRYALPVGVVLGLALGAGLALAVV